MAILYRYTEAKYRSFIIEIIDFSVHLMVLCGLFVSSRVSVIGRKLVKTKVETSEKDILKVPSAFKSNVWTYFFKQGTEETHGYDTGDLEAVWYENKILWEYYKHEGSSHTQNVDQ